MQGSDEASINLSVKHKQGHHHVAANSSLQEPG
jgi:hypothetical protein